MPRSFPTTTGLPLSSGFSDCSTDAKNASQSTWMIALRYDSCMNASFVFSNDTDDDASYDQFAFGQDRRVLRVRRQQAHGARLPFFLVIFERPFAVDLRD